MERYTERAKRVLRENLLDAFGTLIIERGFRRVRMQDVANAVGVSRQTVYNEFGDKWGLARALMLRENARYLDGVDEAISRHSDLYSAVAAAVVYTLETAADDPLKKAALTGDDGEDLLPLFTTQAEPILFAARARLIEHAALQWPYLDQALTNEVVEALVRLTMSHIVLPTEPAEVVAGRLARMIAKYLGEPIPADPPPKE